MTSMADAHGGKGAIEKEVSSRVIELDTEFGSVEERKKIERKLVFKLDCRMTILVIIFLLNYVSANRLSCDLYIG